MLVGQPKAKSCPAGRSGELKVIGQSKNFLPCTVVVASFTPGAATSVTITGAVWWPYAGPVDGDSNMNFLVSGVPLGVNQFNMKPSSLDFTFSGNPATSPHAARADAGERAGDLASKEPEPVLPTIFTLNLYVERDSKAFYVKMTEASSIIGQFAFNGVLYPLHTTVGVPWPT